MTLKDFFKKWQELVISANRYGIPLPMVRDPKKKIGSVSLTLVVISSFLVIVGIVGKWGGWLGGIDMNSAFNFFYASCALYFGRALSNKDDIKAPKEPIKIEIDDPDSK